MKTQKVKAEDGRNLAGPRIKEVRDRTGMTQNTLVERLKKYGVDITACTLSKIETTKRSITDIELVAFMRALDISIDALIDMK